MSSIKINSFVGDVTVGRNLVAGGNADIKGDTVVRKNLRVEGWLDAPNIKEARKGWFATVADLTETYPEPDTGWWALVGTTLPALLYLAREGKWINTGQSTGNEITVDSDAYNKVIDKIKEDSARIKSDIDNINLQFRQLGVLPFDGELNTDSEEKPEFGVWWNSERGSFENFGNTNWYGFDSDGYYRNLNHIYVNGNKLYRLKDYALEPFATMSDLEEVIKKHLNSGYEKTYKIIFEREGESPIKISGFTNFNEFITAIVDNNYTIRGQFIIEIAGVSYQGTTQRLRVVSGSNALEIKCPVDSHPTSGLSGWYRATIDKQFSQLTFIPDIPLKNAIRVESEEEMEKLIASGAIQDGQAYYTEED